MRRGTPVDLEVARSFQTIAAWLTSGVQMANWAMAGGALMGGMGAEISSRLQFGPLGASLATMGMLFLGACLGRPLDRLSAQRYEGDGSGRHAQGSAKPKSLASDASKTAATSPTATPG